MIGQVEPLETGTEIVVNEYGDEHNSYKYIITDIISQGSSGIVYRANRIKQLEDRPEVILKEYYPYNVGEMGMFYRRNGVIVKKGEENIPYYSPLLEVAKNEKKNADGCSGSTKDRSGLKNSNICSINMILSACSIKCPSDQFDDITWNNCKVGVFSVMDSYSLASSFDDLVDSIRDRIYKFTEGSKEQTDIASLMSTDPNAVLSIRGILLVINSILKSVHVVHDFGWVHKDLKLSNLLFERESDISYLDLRTILIDFGSAQKLIPGTDPLHAAKGLPPYTNGTSQGYQPPEILEKNIERYNYLGWTKSADIYQVGCIMYYLLCNEFPPKIIADENYKNINSILAKYNLDEKTNRLIIDILSKAISYDPNRRYSDINEWREAMDEAMIQTSSKTNEINELRQISECIDDKQTYIYDYRVLFSLIDEVKYVLKTNKIFQEDDNYINEKDLNKYGLECISEKDKHNYLLSLKDGLKYIESLRRLTGVIDEMNISSLVISAIGVSIEALVDYELGIRLIKESFKIYNREIKTSGLIISRTSPSCTKASLFEDLWDAISMKCVNGENYYELVEISNNWKKLFPEIIAFDTDYQYRYHYYTRVIELYSFSNDFAKAFECLDKIHDIISNWTDGINIIYAKTDILIYSTYIYENMKDYDSVIDIQTKLLGMLDKNRELYNPVAYIRNVQFANSHLARGYYYKGNKDIAAYHICQSLSALKELYKYQPTDAKRFYKIECVFGRKIYNPTLDSINMKKLILLLTEKLEEK